MHLTKKEEEILEGGEGEVCRKAMEILVALGDIYEADKLIEIESVQVAGVSYKTIGDAGIEFLKDMKGRTVKVPTQLNPAGMDLERWREHGVPQRFAEKQKEILDIFRQMKIDLKCTCTPYQTGLPHGYGQHLAWSESSAVSYVNSVIGARTNREGGPSALAAALIGKTPNYGYHLKENREPDIAIQIEDKKELSGADYGALGRLVGRKIGDKVPYYSLPTNPDKDELKALGAAMASTGAVALYHVENQTPEANDYQQPKENIVISNEEIQEEYHGSIKNIDLVAIGCPHLSTKQLKQIKDLIGTREIKKDTWIFVSRETKTKNKEITEYLEEKGIDIISDTCMVVSPLEELPYEKVMVDSGKAATYLPSMSDVEVTFSNLEKCIEVASSET